MGVCGAEARQISPPKSYRGKPCVSCSHPDLPRGAGVNFGILYIALYGLLLILAVVLAGVGSFSVATVLSREGFFPAGHRVSLLVIGELMGTIISSMDIQPTCPLSTALTKPGGWSCML